MEKLLYFLLFLFQQTLCRLSDPKIIDNNVDYTGAEPSQAPFTFVKMEHKFLVMTEGIIDVGPKEITLSGDGLNYKLDIIFLSWYAELMPDIGVWNKFWDDSCQLGQRFNEFSEEIDQLQQTLEYHTCQCRFLMEQKNLDVNATHSQKNTYFLCFKELEDLDEVDNKISDNYIRVIKDSPVEDFGYPELLRIYTIMMYIDNDPNFENFVQSDIQINEKICVTGTSDQNENSDMCNARKWYQRCGTTDDPHDIDHREDSCVSNHPHVVRLLDKAQEYPIKPLECNNEMEYADIFNCEIKAVEEFPTGLDPGVPTTCCIEFKAKFKFQKGKQPHFTIFCSTVEKSQKCQDQIKTIWHLLGDQCGEMQEEPEQQEEEEEGEEEEEQEEEEEVDLGPQVVDPYWSNNPEILEDSPEEEPIEYEIKDGESINIISSPQPKIDDETEYNEIKGIKEDETSIDKRQDIDNDGNIETTITGQTFNANDPDAAAAMDAMENAQKEMRKSQIGSNDQNEMRKSKIGTLKTNNNQFDLYYPFDTNVAASLMAPPLLPPQQLNTSDTKTMPVDEVKTQAYLNILPHPATHVKDKPNPKSPKVDDLMPPFIALLPNPVINLQANTVIPPFLAKKLVSKSSNETKKWNGKDDKIGGPQLNEEIIEWMHSKGIEYKGPKLEDKIKDNRDNKSPQPEFLIMPLPLPNDKEPPKPYLIQPLADELQVNAEHNVPSQPFLGLPAPAVKGDPTDLHPFIAIPTTLLFSEQIRLEQQQENLSLDQLMQKIKDDGDDDECSDSFNILADPKIANGIALEIEEQTLDETPQPKDLSPADKEKAKGLSGKSLFGQLYGLDDVKIDKIKAGQDPNELPNKGRICEINIAFRYS